MPTHLTPPNPPRALIIGCRWPEPRSTAAGVRTTNVLDLLRDGGWETHFACASARTPRSELPQGVRSWTVKLNCSSFDSWVATLAPQIVVLDRYFIEEQFGWRVRNACPEAALVLDTGDLHFLRDSRQRGLTQVTDSEIAPRELAAILRCDLTWVVSDFERSLLLDELGIAGDLIETSRILYGVPPTPRPFSERAGFATIGTFQHEPNRDSVRWIKNEIWPVIRRLEPQAVLRVYGSYIAPEFSRMHDPTQGFFVEGPVDCATDALSPARVSLAPLRFGAGIKGKILDSWWTGTPVVTTPIGSEGMCGDVAFAGEVASTAEDLARAAVRVHSDETIWQTHAQRGREALTQRHSFKDEAPATAERLRELVRDLERRRNRHWLGRVLRSHSLRSTEYFSRWIEEKSRTANLQN